jgi:hypothetical protein
MEAQMKTHLTITEMAAFVAVMILAAIFVAIGLATTKLAVIPVTGEAPEVKPAFYGGPDFASWPVSKLAQFQITELYEYIPFDYATMDPHERERLQITEPYDDFPVISAAMQARPAFFGGPDYGSWDVSKLAQFQITEPYEFIPFDYASMDPHERERLQITEEYP